MIFYEPRNIWNSMKSRCNSHPHYKDCVVCEEWQNDFSAFSEWFLDNLYDCGNECLELDKDLFSNELKVYSPETCCLLPKRINVMLSYRKAKLGGLPTGISMADSGRYIAMIHRGSGHLTKTFDTLEEAVYYYNSNKKRHIREAAKAREKYLPKRIYDKLIEYEPSCYQ